MIITSKNLGDEVHEMLQLKLAGLNYDDWQSANVSISSEMLWQTVGWLARTAIDGDKTAIEALNFMMEICRDSSYGNRIQTVEVEETVLNA